MQTTTTTVLQIPLEPVGKPFMRRRMDVINCGARLDPGIRHSYC